jgi:hypothetical protein
MGTLEGGIRVLVVVEALMLGQGGGAHDHSDGEDEATAGTVGWWVLGGERRLATRQEEEEQWKKKKLSAPTFESTR